LDDKTEKVVVNLKGAKSQRNMAWKSETKKQTDNIRN